MKSLKVSLVVLSLACGSSGFAGEGHDHSMPGTLPPPPHGGRIGEAKEMAAHNEGHEHGKEEKPAEHGKEAPSHSHSEEPELFIEAKLSGEELSLYALELKEGAKVFQTLSPSEALKVSDLKIEFPRSKKTEAVTVAAAKDNWSAKIPKTKDSRFFAHVTVLKGGEQKQAKIQIEKHK